MTQQAKEHVIKVKKSVLKRIVAPSPDFFIAVQKWCLVGITVFSGLAGFTKIYFPESKITQLLLMGSALATVIVGIISKLPIDTEKTIAKLKK